MTQTPPAPGDAVTQVLRTERLTLRPPTPEDAGFVFALHSDPATNRFNPRGPDRTFEDSRRRLDSWLSDWAGKGLGYHLATLADSGEPIGVCGTRPVDAADWGERPEPVLNLYYRFSPACWGRGLAGEAVRAVLDHAGTRRPGVPVVVVTRPANLPALRLAERLGFRHFRDIVYRHAPAVEYRRELEETAAPATA